MISLVLIAGLVLVSGAAEKAQEAQETEDVAQRVLTNAGYVIRYGDSLYRYPVALRILPPAERSPTETNEIEKEDGEKGRPLFFFTPYGSQDPLPTSRPYIEIRKRRDVGDVGDVPEESKVGKLRRKRTYCRKCGGGGGGGYGGYYVPVTYSVYPVYYGGGGRGCNTCHGGGGGGGGGGSYSYSQSSASSSSGSFGYGKK